jgi:uncharacterized protein (TIGR00730 family)
MKRVTVFCGSSAGERPGYADAARATGAALAARGLGLVYGGGNVGLMGILADSVLAAGGQVIGVIPRVLEEREVAHRGLTELHVVGSMHERKALMADLCDAFIALPGGLGTLEELFEVLTWTVLGLHQKPCGLLDVDGYYASLLGFLDHATTERFVRPEHRALVHQDVEPGALLDKLATAPLPALPRWIDRGQR